MGSCSCAGGAKGMDPPKFLSRFSSPSIGSVSHLNRSSLCGPGSITTISYGGFSCYRRFSPQMAPLSRQLLPFQASFSGGCHGFRRPPLTPAIFLSDFTLSKSIPLYYEIVGTREGGRSPTLTIYQVLMSVPSSVLCTQWQNPMDQDDVNVEGLVT